MVFLGDYVDKGSTSSSVLELMRELQETFTENVVTILGNHDFFQVLDAALEYDVNGNVEDGSPPHPLGHPQHDYVYSFVHPEEYVESGYSPQRDDDTELMDAIYSALVNVYDQHLQANVKFCSSRSCALNLQPDQVDLFTSVSPFSDEGNSELASRARERLWTWREEYMAGLHKAGLIHWMVKQPIVAIVGDAVLVHGGISPNIINYISKVASKSDLSIEDTLHIIVNERFQSFFTTQLQQNDEKGLGPNSIKDRLPTEHFTFELIMNMIQHRGYFKGNGCAEVQTVLDMLKGEGVNRICVGHTPRDYAEQFCSGKLIASDSSLSRSFRAYGNLYCPLNEQFGSGGDNNDDNSSCWKGQFEDTCGGSISYIVRESPKDEWPKTVTHVTMDDLKKRHSSTSNTTPDADAVPELEDEL